MFYSSTHMATVGIKGLVLILLSNSYYESFVRPWIALLTVTVIPFTIILLCNVFIIRALFAFRRLRSEQAIVSPSDKVGTSLIHIRRRHTLLFLAKFNSY